MTVCVFLWMVLFFCFLQDLFQVKRLFLPSFSQWLVDGFYSRLMKWSLAYPRNGPPWNWQLIIFRIWEKQTTKPPIFDHQLSNEQMPFVWVLLLFSREYSYIIDNAFCESLSMSTNHVQMDLHELFVGLRPQNSFRYTKWSHIWSRRYMFQGPSIFGIYLSNFVA